jgi:NADPH-dependent 2,4-dienoyl-CoA reductase/sulfur reductase-like enzyme
MSEGSPERCDVAVIGAGPAGMAAAATCARGGLDTVLIDEQPSPGGQVYRSVTENVGDNPARRGPDYARGADLARELRESGARHLAGTTVWSLDRTLEMGLLTDGAARMVSARRVIIATGAIERPFPFKGWTLPGVMTAGAGQILLKSAGLVPSGRIVIAGCGPLLWLLASQLLAAGARIKAILDTTPSGNWRQALRGLPSFALSPYLAKGLELLAAARNGTRVISAVGELRAEGSDRVERVVYRRRGGVETSLPVDSLLVHHGVVPNTQLAMAAGVEHRWDDVQCAWLPVLGADGQTSVDGIAIAGDGGGIVGARASEAQGRLAGLAAIASLVSPGAATAAMARDPIQSELARHLRGRAFLDLLYRPALSHRMPSGDTIACRCEEVTAQAVVESVRMGCMGPNQLKAFLRCGMGPCQGRQCSLGITELIASVRGVPPQEVGHYRVRFPVKPITVSAMATLPKTEAAIKAADR